MELRKSQAFQQRLFHGGFEGFDPASFFFRSFRMKPMTILMTHDPDT